MLKSDRESGRNHYAAVAVPWCLDDATPTDRCQDDAISIDSEDGCLEDATPTDGCLEDSTPTDGCMDEARPMDTEDDVILVDTEDEVRTLYTLRPYDFKIKIYVSSGCYCQSTALSQSQDS